MSMFKIGDVVYVSNPDRDYEEEYCAREHRSFFGKVTEVETYPSDLSFVTVEFPATPNGYSVEWCYEEKELSLASELKDLSLEEFSNKFGVSVLAEYLQ